MRLILFISIIALLVGEAQANPCKQFNRKISSIATSDSTAALFNDHEKPIVISGDAPYYIYPDHLKSYGEVASCFTIRAFSKLEGGFPPDEFADRTNFRKQLHIHFDNVTLVWRACGRDRKCGTADDQKQPSALVHLGDNYRGGGSESSTSAAVGFRYHTGIFLSGNLTIVHEDKLDRNWERDHVPDANFNGIHSSPTTTISLWNDGITRSSLDELTTRIVGYQDWDDFGYLGSSGGWINRFGEIEATGVGVGFYHTGSEGANHFEFLSLERNAIGYIHGDPYLSGAAHYSANCHKGTCGTRQNSRSDPGGAYIETLLTEGNHVADMLVYQGRRLTYTNLYQEGRRIPYSKVILGAGTTSDFKPCGIGADCRAPEGNPSTIAKITGLISGGSAHKNDPPYFVLGPGFKTGISVNEPSHLILEGSVGSTWVDGGNSLVAAHHNAEGVVDFNGLWFQQRTQPGSMVAPLIRVNEDGTNTPITPGMNEKIKVRLDDMDRDGMVDGPPRQP